jgi:hypothetical protein
MTDVQGAHPFVKLKLVPMLITDSLNSAIRGLGHTVHANWTEPDSEHNNQMYKIDFLN